VAAASATWPTTSTARCGSFTHRRAIPRTQTAEQPGFGSNAFTALEIASRRRLDQWHHIGAPEAAAHALVKALFMGKRTAHIAAAALSAARPDIAIPLLEDALPDLESSRDHQRVAAHALARLKGGEPLTEWATSDNPALRLVAADRLPGKATESSTRCCANSPTTPTAQSPSPRCAVSPMQAPRQPSNNSRASPALSAQSGHACTADPRTQERRTTARNATSFRRTRPRSPARSSLHLPRGHDSGPTEGVPDSPVPTRPLAASRVSAVSGRLAHQLRRGRACGS